MEEVFGEIMGFGYGSDSIMLRLLRSAMDKAHENVQSKEGSIELLNARSKFYEMALILVEGCRELIEEKAQIPETNREKMLSDLKESRDMVKGRLEDLKFSIIDKDIELMERIANEDILRQTLESKEKELVSLRAKLALERTKSEDLLNYQVNVDEGEEGDFCELKNSVDQQMLSIKQKLEDERMSLSSANDLFGDENFEENSMSSIKPEQNLAIEQMSSDIDCLKGTLDLAFGRMQNAEIGPLEKQWRWMIEQETILVSIKGFMSHLQENFEAKIDRKRENQVPNFISCNGWSEFIDEIISLHRELSAFSNNNEAQEKGISGNQSSKDLRKLCRTSSEPLPELEHAENSNEDQDSERSTYVAKIIKNHESIIRKQHEELNWMKIRDIFRGKESSFGKKNKDPDHLYRKIREVISRLENVIEWNAKIQDQKRVTKKRKVPKKENFSSEINKLKQERDDLCMQTMFIEEIYAVLLKGSTKEFHQEFHDYKITSLTENDISMCCLRGMVNEWKNFFEGKCLEDSQSLDKLDESIESRLRENLYSVLFREMVNELEIERDLYDYENLMQEDIYNFVVVEAAKDATEFVTKAEAHDRFSVEKPEFKEDIEIQKIEFSAKGSQNQEEMLLDNYLCSPLPELEQIIGDFESLAHEKLELNFLRLEELTRETHNLFPRVSSQRKGELLYKKAFERRCHNLVLAENEVDLLGDQVDELISLLEKIYLILDQNLPTFSSKSWVSDILNLIKKELWKCTH